MARARNIKPGLFKNEDLAECSIWARYIFAGLWTLADREGRLEDRPKRIKGELLPFDSQDAEPLLRELAQNKFLERYEVDGERFIQITKFLKHQSPHYSEKKSVIKPPPLPEKPPDIDPSNSGSPPVIKEGSQPPDSLIPDSLIPDSLQKQKHTRKKKNGLDVEQPPDVSLQVWIDWKRLRANKRAPITATAIAGIRRECKKAGISFADALALSCERGWAGFKAEWIAGDRPIDYDELIATANAREEANAH